MTEEKKMMGRLTLDELKTLFGVEFSDRSLKAFEGHTLARVYKLEDQVHANFIEAMLKQEGIPFLLRTYKDTAYDGLFTSVNGWGEILTREGDAEKALSLITEILESRKFEAPELEEEPKG